MSSGAAPRAVSAEPRTDLRYERKYLVPPHEIPVATHAIRRHPLHFSEAYPERLVNNLYLDTPAWTSLRDNVDGTPERIKARFRWYGEARAESLPTALEFKLKRGLVGWKRTFDLGRHAFSDELALSLDALRRRAREQIDDPRLLSHFERSSCVVFNRYRRRYYRSACGRVRLTLDRDLQFSATPAARESKRPLRTRDAVLELKYAPEHDSVVREATTSFAYRYVRMSKYVTGLLLIRRV